MKEWWDDWLNWGKEHPLWFMFTAIVGNVIGQEIFNYFQK